MNSGFLAAGAGWFLQSRQEASRIKKLKDLVTQSILEDMENSILTYSEISQRWRDTNIIWFDLLNGLDDSRGAYYRNRDSITLLDKKIREKITNYYRKSTSTLSQLRYQQDRKYYLLNKAKTAQQELMFKNPKMNIDKSIKIVVDSSMHDSDELDYINKSLPELVNSLEGLRNDARAVLGELKK